MLIRSSYTCPGCSHTWVCTGPVAYHSICPKCDLRDVEPTQNEEIQEDLLNRIIDELNSALAADPDAISMLLGLRVPCNQTLADHPTVQVLSPPLAGTTVGALGLLNSVIDVAMGSDAAARGGNAYVAAGWDIKLGKVVKFVRYTPELAASSESGRTLI